MVEQAKQSMRTLSIALETYFVDYNTYPLYDSRQSIRMPAPGEPALPSFQTNSVTTPIAYISQIPADPFSASGQTFVYYSVNDPQNAGRSGWILLSPGPDGRFDLDPTVYSPEGKQPQDELIIHAWDPTNGVVSRGDIWRIKQQ